MSSEKLYMGIDQSLTKTGIVVSDSEGVLKYNFLIKTDNKKDMVYRLLFIVSRIYIIITSLNISSPVFIEGLSNRSLSSRRNELAALFYLIVSSLYILGIEYLQFAPKSMKLRITGNGNASKEEVRDTLNKRFNTNIKKLDISDAYGILISGLEEIGIIKK